MYQMLCVFVGIGIMYSDNGIRSVILIVQQDIHCCYERKNMYGHSTCILQMFLFLSAVTSAIYRSFSLSLYVEFSSNRIQ